MIVESLPKLDRQRRLSSFLLVANQKKPNENTDNCDCDHIDRFHGQSQ
jgi:hypothetical protein